ncbi:Carboxyesterase 17 [Tripterygium wilfordii]|uniref:Carboxyesterase 17 n=1 Tax=Tripterygium wilfordii TaxID=458696 RepID=A0A7J7CUX9_TRIWF|nr:probable carboxylesterase 17 [Tripterygium wilfordii]KAF5737890.1 Carboxyesterase 17 [Tripterygium wilfordii]
MATISFDPRLNHQVGKNNHGVVLEEIEGLIRVYKDGNVERPPIISNVSCTSALGAGVTTRDVVIDSFTNLWARIYVPSCHGRVPVLVYFHGGGFCVGSAAWSCYHDFLANLAIKASCVILSINYRLAPENRLPAAYEDGTTAIVWLKQQALNGSGEHKWWLSRCNFSSLLLAGDSAGANIAYHVTTRLGTNGTLEPSNTNPLRLKGTILIQPFFGGEARTRSEKNLKQPPNSALTLPASDTYWRLSLPIGANRDHPWCNPLANGASKLHGLVLPSAMLMCISEMDILKDRNMGFSNALASAGKRVEVVMHKGVGHAFQILHNSPPSQARTQEMVSHLKSFINKNQ